MQLHSFITLALAILSSAPFSAAQSSHVEEGRLLAPSSLPLASLGAAVALCGQRAAAGGAVGSQTGQVHTYLRANGLWNHEASASAADGAANDEFGNALALYGDTLVVGAPNAPLGSLKAGAAYVFVFDGTNWVQQAKLTPLTPKNQGRYGAAVVVDGDTLAVGGPQTDYWSQGLVDVFVRSGGTWTLQQTLVPAGLSFGARAGSALALEGQRLLVGAPIQTLGSLPQVGRAFVFERAGATWTEVAVLDTPAPLATGTFGAALALEGDLAVVGAIGEPATNAFQGRAHVFARSGGSWSHQQTLAGNGSGLNTSFGQALALEGTRLLIGAPGHNNAQAGNAGSVKYFTHDGTSWSERADLFGASSSTFDALGRSVALAGDLALGGAPNGDAPNGRGEAYAWQLDPPAASTYCTAKLTSNNCLPAIGSSGTCSASSSAPFLISAGQLPNNRAGLLFYGGYYSQSPFQGGTKCVANPVRRTAPQDSAGSPSGSDCSGTYALDFNARIQSGLDPTLLAGEWIFAQYWFRDPASAATTGLSDALRFLILP